MTENSSNKKYKFTQKQKQSINQKEITPKNIINFQEPNEDPINQIRNSVTNGGLNDEYNHNLLQVELGDDIIINNHLQENFVDNLNNNERIQYLLNNNKNEQIDFINTLLKLKGVNNIVINDNDNENNINLTGINHLNSNIKPDDESKSYIKEILDICDNNNINKNLNNTGFSEYIIFFNIFSYFFTH